ncbi:MAG: DUF3601 domain-containing protein [Planctomycetes bacterium]|nr:DUF3601 domain-containing protein [Planctomycetota bacterium]
MDEDAVRGLVDAGAFDEALALLRDAAPGDPTTSWLVAEAHERRGDMLWFHDRPGSGEAYRAAMDALLPRQPARGGRPADAARRQEAWSRIAEKVLYGTGPDGRRRPGAVGRPHPHGDPPRQPPPEPAVDAPANPPADAPAKPPWGVPADDAPDLAACGPVPTAPTGARRLDRPADRGDRGPLRVGRSYRIVRSFQDFDGILWTAGTVVVYRGSEYFPYDDGLTLHTDRGSIRLCGLMADNAAVMEQLDAHFDAV